MASVLASSELSRQRIFVAKRIRQRPCGYLRRTERRDRKYHGDSRIGKDDRLASREGPHNALISSHRKSSRGNLRLSVRLQGRVLPRAFRRKGAIRLHGTPYAFKVAPYVCLGSVAHLREYGYMYVYVHRVYVGIMRQWVL